jgi:hypothetical protein
MKIKELARLKSELDNARKRLSELQAKRKEQQSKIAAILAENQKDAEEYAQLNSLLGVENSSTLALDTPVLAGKGETPQVVSYPYGYLTGLIREILTKTPGLSKPQIVEAMKARGVKFVGDPIKKIDPILYTKNFTHKGDAWFVSKVKVKSKRAKELA